MLTHGSYHYAWCWKGVVTRVRAPGHEVTRSSTLTGLGERSHLMSIEPSMETLIEEVAQMIRYEDLCDLILVGHNFAGSVVSAFADRMPGKISR